MLVGTCIRLFFLLQKYSASENASLRKNIPDGKWRERNHRLYRQRGSKAGRYGDNRESESRGYTDNGDSEGVGMATMGKAEAEPIRITGIQRGRYDDNRDRKQRLYR